MAETILDARGLRCPLPVLKLEKAIEGRTAGDILVVLATDPMARIDIPLYCTQRGHACTLSEENGVLRLTVTVGR